MIKKYKPTTPTRRHTTIVKDDRITHDIKAPSSLIKSIRYKSGRSFGKVTTRHKGNKVRNMYRVIDFKRDKKNIEAIVEAIHYDPNRNASIALLKYKDGERRYILATKKMYVGQIVISADEAPIEDGNAMPLSRVPSGMFVHNIELKKGQGGILARSAGCGIQKQGTTGKYTQIKLPSREVRLVREECYATIGEVGNEEYSNLKIGKAGRKRKMGVRPTVRGVAMSWGHPHAGGQGKSGRVGTGGPAKTPWGKKQGKKTRANKRTNKYIIQRRTTKRRPNVKKYKTIV